MDDSKYSTKNKKKIIIILSIIIVIVIIITAIIIIVEHKKNNEEKNVKYGGVPLEDNFPLNDSNRLNDDDNDGLTNEQEKEYGTFMRNSDTDGDGLKDGEEVLEYNTNPLKYSTSDDSISDYIKVKRGLDISRKYSKKEVLPERVNLNEDIALIPRDIESQYYGGVNIGEVNEMIGTYYPNFNFINYEGNLEYKLVDDSDVIVLIHEDYQYKKYSDYKQNKNLLTITVSKNDNFKDFVITSIEKYNEYLNSK